jgi:hypothetical protein
MRPNSKKFSAKMTPRKMAMTRIASMARLHKRKGQIGL